jgi:hypothetical protein
MVSTERSDGAIHAIHALDGDEHVALSTVAQRTRPGAPGAQRTTGTRHCARSMRRRDAGGARAVEAWMALSWSRVSPACGTHTKKPALASKPELKRSTTGEPGERKVRAG